MLSTRRMEHGTPLLANFDLGAIIGAQEAVQNGDKAAVAEFIRVLSVAGKARSIRAISAVARASTDQLREAEANPAVMAILEEAAAERPFLECFKDAIGFFGDWAGSFKEDQDSSDPAKVTTALPESQAASPSADSSPR